MALLPYLHAIRCPELAKCMLRQRFISIDTLPPIYMLYEMPDADCAYGDLFQGERETQESTTCSGGASLTCRRVSSYAICGTDIP
eukprot:98196-Rhodomonas_salina.2